MLINYEVADGIAHITLNRPEKRNALNPELIAAIQESLARAAADKDTRVILLRGAGKDFCAGLDLSTLSNGDDVMDQLAHARSLADVYLAMRRHPKPIIAAVHGRAIGGGAGIATAADILVMEETSELRYPEVNFGFIAAIVVSLLRRQIGEKRAFEIVTLAEPVTAGAAVQFGIANAIANDGGLGYATRLASKSPSAISLTKSLLYHIDAMPLEASLEAGVVANALARQTAEFKKHQGKS